MLIPFGVFSAGVSSGNGGAGSFDLISTTILSSSAASVVFSLTGLSATYKHLQIRMTARTDRVSTIDNISMQFNGDTATNYSNHQLVGDGSTVSSSYNSLTRLLAGLQTGSSYTGSAFGASTLDILDPFVTTKNTTIRALTGAASNVRLYSGVWLNTAALTSINMLNFDGNFVAGSRFSIYGVK